MVLPPIQTQVGNQSDLYLHSPASPPYHPTMMPPLTLTNLPTMTSMSLIIFFLGYYIHVSNVSAFSLTPPHSKPSYGATNTHTHKIILKIKKKKSHPRSVSRLPFLQDWNHISKGAKQDV